LLRGRPVVYSYRPGLSHGHGSPYLSYPSKVFTVRNWSRRPQPVQAKRLRVVASRHSPCRRFEFASTLGHARFPTFTILPKEREHFATKAITHDQGSHRQMRTRLLPRGARGPGARAGRCLSGGSIGEVGESGGEGRPIIPTERSAMIVM